MKKAAFCFIILLALLASCNNSSNSTESNEKVEEKEQFVFKSDEIGWEVKIPEGWDIQSNERLMKDVAEGKEFFKEKGKELSFNDETFILFVARKADIGRFQAAATPFKSDSIAWQYAYRILKSQIFEAFRNPELGLSVDSSSSKTKIDGLEFDIFKVNVYNKNKLAMTQVMYRKLINEYDFAITTTYDKHTLKNEIEEALNSSKFHR